MELSVIISKSFKNGMSYNEAAQLCLRLFCSTDGIDDKLSNLCSKENLALTFSTLAKSNFISGYSMESTLYGANYHDITDKGHWVEVIASIFKIGDTVDKELGDKLISHITSDGKG